MIPRGLHPFVLTILCAILITPTVACLFFATLASSSTIAGFRSQLTGKALSLIQKSSSYLVSDLERSPFGSDRTGLRFSLDSVRHHSTQDDFVELSASYSVSELARPISTPVFTRQQRVRRLANPSAYVSHRNHLLALTEAQAADPTKRGTALVSTLASYHSMLEWEDVDIIVPNISKRSTLLALAKMSSSAYQAPPDSPTWEPGFGGWNLTESFGWIENGIRGHIFSNGPEKEIIVVALKGTSAGILPGGDDTSRRDKLNDNLLFSCCCARVSWTWSPICPCPFNSKTCSQPCLERSLLIESVYYPLITDLYNNISYAYPTSQIWVTGHSLGGALSSLIGMTFGVPSVTFEAPAERMAAQRLHLPIPSRLPNERKEDVPRLPITHVFHNADPIPMGTCVGPSSLCGSVGYAMESKCHAGDVVLYNTTGLLGWRQNVATHRIATLVDDLLAEDWRDKVKTHVESKSSKSIREGRSIRETYSTWWPWKGKKGQDEDGDHSWLDDLGEVPEVSDQVDCQDCESWEFVDRDKTK